MAKPGPVVRLPAVAVPRRFTYRGVWTVWPAVLGLVAYFVLRQVLDPWLNASSDAKFWTAAAIVAAPVFFSVFAIARAIRAPKRP
jgi:hypothetical protein